jgi:hypothetical protein
MHIITNINVYFVWKQKKRKNENDLWKNNNNEK